MAVKMVATNKQAHRNYEISETIEAGIATIVRIVPAWPTKNTAENVDTTYSPFDGT